MSQQSRISRPNPNSTFIDDLLMFAADHGHHVIGTLDSIIRTYAHQVLAGNVDGNFRWQRRCQLILFCMFTAVHVFRQRHHPSPTDTTISRVSPHSKRQQQHKKPLQPERTKVIAPTKSVRSSYPTNFNNTHFRVYACPPTKLSTVAKWTNQEQSLCDIVRGPLIGGGVLSSDLLSPTFTSLADCKGG